MMQMSIPECFTGYHCQDYYDSGMPDRGIWSESEELWLIVPTSEVIDYPELRFLCVGRPGVDGIEFGYRRDHEGLWAYFPIDRHFKYVAPSVDALVEGWLKCSITV